MRLEQAKSLVSRLFKLIHNDSLKYLLLAGCICCSYFFPFIFLYYANETCMRTGTLLTRVRQDILFINNEPDRWGIFCTIMH